MLTKHPRHSVDLLRTLCRQNANRPYVARGSNAIRCPSCLMASFACFCDHRTIIEAPFEFILLFHRDEIHKPTNSGRLIADLFPNDTHAFIWDRKSPETALLDLLEEKKGHCSILFPDTATAQEQNRQTRTTPLNKTPDNKKHTFIVLDGTWKQASKMFHQSDWLKAIPHLEISSEAQRAFLVRHSTHDMQFGTAEVVALLMDSLGHKKSAEALLTYNQIFNQHCLASRKRGNKSISKHTTD